MSDIGKNIKHERTIRNMTIKELADRIYAVGGGDISESMISMWENGKRRIYADQLQSVCLALHISPCSLYGNNVNFIESELKEEIDYLPDDEKYIFYHLLHNWNGNKRALIKFMGLYMALPRKLRLDIAGMGLTVYKIGKDSKQLDPTAPLVDVEYIDDAWGELMK